MHISPKACAEGARGRDAPVLLGRLGTSVWGELARNLYLLEALSCPLGKLHPPGAEVTVLVSTFLLQGAEIHSILGNRIWCKDAPGPESHC